MCLDCRLDNNTITLSFLRVVIVFSICNRMDYLLGDICQNIESKVSERERERSHGQNVDNR